MYVFKKKKKNIQYNDKKKKLKRRACSILVGCINQ